MCYRPLNFQNRSTIKKSSQWEDFPLPTAVLRIGITEAKLYLSQVSTYIRSQYICIVSSTEQTLISFLPIKNPPDVTYVHRYNIKVFVQYDNMDILLSCSSCYKSYSKFCCDRMLFHSFSSKILQGRANLFSIWTLFF